MKGLGFVPAGEAFAWSGPLLAGVALDFCVWVICMEGRAVVAACWRDWRTFGPNFCAPRSMGW